ncbi:hypothetical protein [Corynebacterium sp. CCM 9204]|uniref:hypothetical protein n=1 Tax=Corynebacterium sp. CCM 9204 TaxID=3057616 RepID=UPI003523F98E
MPYVDPRMVSRLRDELKTLIVDIREIQAAQIQYGFRVVTELEREVEICRRKITEYERYDKNDNTHHQMSREYDALNAQLQNAMAALNIAEAGLINYRTSSRASLQSIQFYVDQGVRYLQDKLNVVLSLNAESKSDYAASTGSGIQNGRRCELTDCYTALPVGFTLVAVSEIDQSENPIVGPQDFGKGYSIEDLSRAFDLLERYVLPGMDRGWGKEEFKNIDEKLEMSGCRSLSDTYSGFFDEHAGNYIRLEARSDGKYGIINGRHRIYVAEKTGRTVVPAKISR